ncbi:hypothetical protein Dimus_002955 [Dionaea muscipula]
MHGEVALPELGRMHGDAALPELGHMHGDAALPELDHVHGEEALPELGHVHGEEAPPDLGDTSGFDLLPCSSVQQEAEVDGLVGARHRHARLLPDALLRSAFFHGRSTLSSHRMGEEGNSSSPQARPLARRPELGDILIFGLLVLVFTPGKKKGSRPSSMHGLGLRVSP